MHSSVSKPAGSAPTVEVTALLSPGESESYTTFPNRPKPPPVTWASLPRKGQLAVIVLARLAEPLSERSLTSYLFYQLKWFDPALPASEIAKQYGYLTATFAAAQCLTSMWWGYAADSPLLGRKRVLLIGLFGSSISALGMGFSRSLAFVFLFRFLVGALNGNIGVLRTVVSEVVVEKRYQSRAFLLLPMCFNVGVIIGPLISGFLADPVRSLPSIFGPGSFLGGSNGVAWLQRFPYALPNLVSAMFLSLSALLIILGLDETHPQLRHRPDRGRQLGKLLLRMISNDSRRTQDYEVISQDIFPHLTPTTPEDGDDGVPDMEPENKSCTLLRALCTKNVFITLLQRFLQALHVSAFNAIFFTLLPTPKEDGRSFHLPFRFSGGLGLSSQKVGLANTTIGMIGIPMQILLYPVLSSRFGTRKSYLVFLPLSIISYCLLPYLVLLPADNIVLVWTCLSTVLILHITSRTFVNPATMMLVNDCAPCPTLLGTVHGLATSISGAARIVGPTTGGAMLGWGLSHNFVGLPLWILGVVAVVNWLLVLLVRELDEDA